MKYFEVIYALEAKPERTKVEEDLLKMNRQLVEVTQSNQRAASNVLSAVVGVGFILSGFGATKWHRIIQLRDDKLAEVQLEKLKLEVASLRAQVQSAPVASEAGDG